MSDGDAGSGCRSAQAERAEKSWVMGSEGAVGDDDGLATSSSSSGGSRDGGVGAVVEAC